MCLNECYNHFTAKKLLRHMVQKAKSECLTINVRHAKILFCGSSRSGKTSFSRLLRNETHENDLQSTPAGDAQQVIISGKVDVTDRKWVNLDSKLETQELTKKMILKLQGTNQDEDKSPPAPITDNEKLSKQVATEATHTSKVVDVPITESKGQHYSSSADNQLPLLSHTKTKLPDCDVLSNKTEEEMAAVNMELNGTVPDWDLFTLLDTGGQPQLINMLPAINHSTAITFIVLNISEGKECLNNQIIAQYNSTSHNYKEHKLKYTNKHLLECLLSSVKIAAIKTDNFNPEIIKMVTRDEHEQPQPVVCVIGTHADILKENLEKNMIQKYMK